MGDHGVSQEPIAKPRVVRGSERLKTRLSELAGLVLAGLWRFENILNWWYQAHQLKIKSFLCRLTIWLEN